MSNSTPLKSADHEQDAKHADTAVSSTVNKDSVAKYLLEHPSFLIENPELLAQLQVQLQAHGVVSLTQLQAEQAREKIKQLKLQLEQLVSYARTNEKIYKTYAQLNVDLAKTQTISEIEQTIQRHLVSGLGLEAANLLLINMPEHKPEQALSEIQHRSIFDKKLAKSDFYFGRIGTIEKAALFPNANAESVALIRLSSDSDQVQTPDTIGLIAIASNDSMHFQPKMDTVLVEFLRKNVNLHVQRLSRII